jgi:hypothetical protein
VGGHKTPDRLELRPANVIHLLAGRQWRWKIAAMSVRLPSIVALAAVLTGCGRDSAPTVEPRTPMPATLAGVYGGELPCSNCAAIDATLWLRPDGRFFFRQQLRDTAAPPSAQGPPTTYGLGLWFWDEHTAEAVLRGAGPERRLTVPDGQHLQLQVPAPIDHVLARDEDAPTFGDKVTLDGESAVTEDGATFKECLTGLALRVIDAGAYRELRRQHRRMNPRGKIALTTVEAHLVTAGTGATTSERLVVDRFITMKPGRGC